MARLHLSIRTTLLSIIGILNFIIVVFVGVTVSNSWHRYQEAQTLKEASYILDFLYDANKNLSIERGTALSVVAAAPSSAETLKEEMAQSRYKSDKAMRKALAALGPVAMAQTKEAVTKVRKKYQALQDLRKELDEVLRQPLEKRDRTISDRFYKKSTALIADIQNLILAYSNSFQDIHPAIARQMLFKYFVWELAEYAGEEYAIIGRLIVEDKYPTIEQKNQLFSLRGHIKYGWEIVRKLSTDQEVAENIQPYLQEAETHYFLTFDQISDVFYSFGPMMPSRASYPISIEMWLGMASQAVDSLLALQDEVLKVTQNRIDLMEQQARNELTINFIVLLAALSLGLYCASIVVFRVIRPVNAMVNTLYDATRGEVIKKPYIPHYHDEIGKLAEVLDSFQKTARKMKQSNEELERFAYITAHDLKSPLRAIDNLSQWIEEDLEDVLTGESRVYMDKLRGRVRRLEKLLDDTLEYSRLEAKLAHKSSDIVNGRKLIEDTVNMLAPPKGFTVKIGDGLTDIELVRLPLQQVFYNLIGNAIKHHDKEKRLIEVDVKEEGDHYLFSVKDDGPGIPARYHDKIFEMFQTLESRDTREGSGMGLAFVKKILTIHGGDITVESGGERGAVFRFTWPKSEKER